MLPFNVDVLLDFFGLLAVLAAAAMVFAMVFRWLAGKGHHPLGLGLSLLTLLSVLLVLATG